MAQRIDQKLWQLERRAKAIFDTGDARLPDLTQEFTQNVTGGL